MKIIDFILLLVGAFFFASAWSGWPWRIERGPFAPGIAAGLFFWIMVPLIHAAQALG